MHYKKMIAKNRSEAHNKIFEQYGNEAYIVRTDDKKRGGFLGIGSEKYVEVLFALTEADYLNSYKHEMSRHLNKSISQGNDKKLNTPKSAITSSSDERPEEPGNKNSDMKSILEKLEKLERSITSKSENNESKKSENIKNLEEVLYDNEFSRPFIEELVNKIESELSVREVESKDILHNFVYDFFNTQISELVSPPLVTNIDNKKIIVLVGPTGVGKTTTIAKLAANAYLEKKKFELITIDGFRMGAKEQLKRYSDILNVNLTSVETNEELQRIVALSDAELILIDTTGRSQKDELNLVKMKTMLNLDKYKVNYILTLSSTTKPKEIKKVFKSFEIFDYESIIITKLDESDTIGSILELAMTKKKGILYYTNGQQVPQEIEKATSFNLISKITGLDSSVLLSHAKY